MSVQAVRWVRDLRNMKGNQKAVLFVIAEHADKYGANSFPSIETISVESGVSVRTVQRVKDELVSFGLLEYEERTTRSGKDTSHTYTLPMDRLSPLGCEERRKARDKAQREERKRRIEQNAIDTIMRQQAQKFGPFVQNSAEMTPSILTTNEPPKNQPTNQEKNFLEENTQEEELDILELMREHGL